jgi:transketolase
VWRIRCSRERKLGHADVNFDVELSQDTNTMNTRNAVSPPLEADQIGLRSRRGVYRNILNVSSARPALSTDDTLILERIDLVYRTLCSILFNFVPTSGHPGGSLSSGRIVEALLYQTMEYDFANPDREESDILSYAAGHKALGLYAMWALRNELVRQGSLQDSLPRLMPDEHRQLRLEDLLGFRRNPTNDTPLFRKLKAKALDGHPTCATPFVRIATGASGVGVPASMGLALAALDVYRDDPPTVHILEGEGGMTPGRVHEALAAAATSQLYNVVLHIDWNQASIDSNRVCSEHGEPGDYVQWNPMELCYLHDWNVIVVPDGHDFQQILSAQRLARSMPSKQPTAIVYRTRKGWKYGIEGRESHGAGHKFCSDGYYATLREFEETFQLQFPRFDGAQTPERVEATYYDSLMRIRTALERSPDLTRAAAVRLACAQERLIKRDRRPRANAPERSALYQTNEINPRQVPSEVQVTPGSSITLREVLGKSLNVLNRNTGGAIFGAAADLLGSTSVSQLNKGFPDGFFNAVTNADSRLLSIGGICEDAMGALMAGLSSFGHHIGVTSSYGAFIAALEHVAARLHGIGQQTREMVTGEPYNTWIMVNAHAGVKTGEDGPTHADPQALQLLQECFPPNVMITLTPWDPQEIWPLLVAGLQRHPAILAPFVTRPPEIVPDRASIGLPPAYEAVNGLYAIRKADRSLKQYNGTVVLQGNGVASIFINEVLPRLDAHGLNLNIVYITSVELFKLLPVQQQDVLFPESLASEAIGITDFTMPTLYQFVRSNEWLRKSLHPFRGGHYLGSGSASKVLQEAGVHAEGQFETVMKYAAEMEKRHVQTMMKSTRVL